MNNKTPAEVLRNMFSNYSRLDPPAQEDWFKLYVAVEDFLFFQLCGEPLFTREDVELLRETLPADVLHLGYQYEEEPQAYLHDLADRIEARLPPEKD